MRLGKDIIFLPEGFTYHSTYCGITSSPKKKDLGLIYSLYPCKACGLFTQSSFKAPSVLITQKHLQKAKPRAILVNSGCANCATGKKGFLHVERMTEQVASGLDIRKEEVLVAQTGIIGEELPYHKVKKGISSLLKGRRVSNTGVLGFVRSIMTTDTIPKIVSRRFILPSSHGEIKILGIAKGSGMIQPNLATMLAFILSDISISSSILSGALKDATKRSLNALTVDGETSPNDMVLMLANGCAKNRTLVEKDRDFEIFYRNLLDVLLELTRMIASDGEGATKLIEVEVIGAKSQEEAERAARAIANSPLVKTAIFGCDPNWGRILASLGSANIKFSPEKIDIYLVPLLKGAKRRILKLVSRGRKVSYSSNKSIKDAMERDFVLKVDLNNGKYKSKIFTCDLSYDYIKINAEYHS